LFGKGARSRGTKSLSNGIANGIAKKGQIGADILGRNPGGASTHFAVD